MQVFALLLLMGVSRQQPSSLQSLPRVCERKIRIIALTVVQQLGVDQLTDGALRCAASLAQLGFSCLSNSYPARRLLNQLPLQQESGA